MENGLYRAGIDRALREGAITVYGKQRGGGKNADELTGDMLAAPPPIYDAVIARAPSNFRCLMVEPSMREAAEAKRSHGAQVQTVGRRALNPWMFPNFGITPNLHSQDTLTADELLAKMQRSSVEGIRSGVRRDGAKMLLSADALCSLPLTLEKGGRGTEATSQQTTFLSPTLEPFLTHQHIGALHEIPVEKLEGPFALIYISSRARTWDLIGIPLSIEEGARRRKECARRIVPLLSEGGIALGLGGIDGRMRRAIAECLGPKDVYVVDRQADLIVRGGSGLAAEALEDIADRERPTRVADVLQVFRTQRRKSGT
jgi:hypothetical protein